MSPEMRALLDAYDAAAGPIASDPKSSRIDWSGAGRVHDWRNHVPDLIKNAWEHLDVQSRMVAFLMAEEEASGEEWD